MLTITMSVCHGYTVVHQKIKRPSKTRNMIMLFQSINSILKLCSGVSGYFVSHYSYYKHATQQEQHHITPYT